MYLIWSYEHNAWWKPGAQGYTPDAGLAGLYVREQAMGFLHQSMVGGNLNEILIPEKVAKTLGHPRYHPYYGAT